MRWIIAALALIPPVLSADGASDLAAQVREVGLDPAECYRVREINFSREDVRIYLTEGYLIFGKPVNGRRISAVFTADVDGGDGEVLLMPPHRSERLSLATFTKSPNLNEHFHSTVMLFTDDTAAELLAQIHARERVRKSPEMGVLLEDRWKSVVRNLSSSFEIRLVLDLLGGRSASSGFFFAAAAGKRLGNFDIIYDPLAHEQIQIGQVVFRETRSFFDIWTSFRARSFRNGSRPAVEPEFTLRNIRIDATLEPDLSLSVVTSATVSVHAGLGRALYFDISRRMRVTEVLVNGDPAEVFQRESLRANLIRGNDNELFLVVTPLPLEAGRHYEVQFRHEGRVVAEAGRQVYFVGSRGTWYPQAGLRFAEYDITFHYPEGLDLVFPGELMEDRTEEGVRTTRRKTGAPIRLAGFNLGHYECVKVNRAGYQVEVYANRTIEPALQPRNPQMVLVPPPSLSGWPRNQRRIPDVIAIPSAPPAPDPTARLEELANEVAGAYEYMAVHFGPPSLRSLTVSPIPGVFGQGFPGLVYLSTISYLEPKDRPAAARHELQHYFFSEILHAHETAHQWWGNIVTAASYQEEWLMEALANYSALLILEKRKGARALRSVLDQYIDHLLAKNEEGRTLESAGPISWGTRLNSSQADAWRPITYEKGSWIIHMLRRRLGDERFLAMLGELCKRYRYKAINTEEFRALAAEFLPKDSPDPKLESFFEHWVYGTGVPSLKLAYSVKGKSPKVTVTGTVTQSNVPGDFSVWVPVEIQLGRGDSLTRWVRTTSEPVPFTATLRSPPQKVLLDPRESVMAVRK